MSDSLAAQVAALRAQVAALTERVEQATAVEAVIRNAGGHGAEYEQMLARARGARERPRRDRPAHLRPVK